MRAQSAASVGEVRGADAASRNPFCRSNTSLTGPRSLAVHTRRICFPLWTLTVLRSDNEKRFLKKLTGQGKDAERVTLPIIINNTFRALSFPLPGNAEGGQRPQCSNRPTPRSQLLCRLSSVCRQCSVVTLLKSLFYICPVGGSVGWLPHVLCLSPQSRWHAPMFTLYLPAMY